MYDLIATFGAILLGLVSLVVLTVFLSVLRSGPGEIAYLRRKDYGLRSWVTGALRKPARGATMRELEGIELKSRGGSLSGSRPPSSRKQEKANDQDACTDRGGAE